MPVKAVIFDLDGTLLNSLPDIANSVNAVLDEFKLPTHSFESIQKMVGNGYRILLQRAVPEAVYEDTVLFNQIEKRGREFYEQKTCVHSEVYEGIYPLLDFLKQERIQICMNTNKPHNLIQPILDFYFAEHPFPYALGQVNGEPIKPDPSMAKRILAELSMSKEQVLFVGDSPVDVQTAKNAGLQSIAVSWGFSSKEELVQAKPDFLINHPQEIKQIIADLA